MSRGQPDFGMYAVKEVASSSSDLGEIAARLGSIVTYDRRGDVVIFDNFESPILKWKRTGTSPACYARFDSTHVASESQAIKLHTEGVNDYSMVIEKYVMAVASKRLGAELRFSNISPNCVLSIEMNLWAGTILHAPAFLFNPSTGDLQIFDENLALQTIANIGTILNQEHFYHSFKMVVDFDLDKYVRLMFDLKEYDISAYSIYTEGGVIAPYLQFRLLIQNELAAENEVWLDNFIYTQEEP